MKILKKDSSQKKDDTKKKVSRNKNKASSSSSSTFIGIDITGNQVKLVAISGKSLDSLTLENYVITPLENNVIHDNKINDEEKLVASLQQSLNTLRVSGKGFIAAMPETISTVQTFICADEDVKDLAEIAEFEINQIADIDEVNYDYQIIGPANNSADHEVLLVLTRKEDLEPRLFCLDSAKMSPLLYMDIDSFANINAFSHWINQQQPELTNQIIAICDIGMTVTNIIIAKNGKKVFEQPAEIGGLFLDQAIQQKYQVNLEGAIKIKHDANKPQGYLELETQFNQQVASAIQRAFQFYKTLDIGSGAEADIQQVLITGGASNIANMSDVIQSTCRVPTQVINPVDFLTHSKHIDSTKLATDSSMLNIAFGLCLRGFND